MNYLVKNYPNSQIFSINSFAIILVCFKINHQQNYLIELILKKGLILINIMKSIKLCFVLWLLLFLMFVSGKQVQQQQSDDDSDDDEDGGDSASDSVADVKIEVKFLILN